MKGEITNFFYCYLVNYLFNKILFWVKMSFILLKDGKIFLGQIFG